MEILLAAIFAASGNIPQGRLISTESEGGFERKLAANFTSFGGILSATVGFLSVNLFRNGFIWDGFTELNYFEWKLFG